MVRFSLNRNPLPKHMIMEKQSFYEASRQWSNAKLLSFVLNAGTKYQSVDELESALNDHFLDFNSILQVDEDALREIKGIGPVKAKQIMAVLALHQAWSIPKPIETTIRKSQDAYAHFKHLQFPAHEEFHVLYLNRAHAPLACHQLFRGGLTGTVTDVRLILKKALHWNATAIIVAHNHPSGALVPSENDKRMTRKLSAAADTLDIELLDHLIVARSGYFSFSDQGLL